jgi:hypothetical protein
MRVDYLLGFLQYLSREHDIDIVKEEFSDWGDGSSNLHSLSDEDVLKLAKEYRHHVINTGEI